MLICNVFIFLPHTHTKKMMPCVFARKRSLLDVSYVTAVRWSALPSREETTSEDYVATSASSATCAALRCRPSAQQSVSCYVTAERG